MLQVLNQLTWPAAFVIVSLTALGLKAIKYVLEH